MNGSQHPLNDSEARQMGKDLAEKIIFQNYKTITLILETSSQESICAHNCYC
jgi:hypothetical protein